jgi:AraC-like DNA-binding protein
MASTDVEWTRMHVRVHSVDDAAAELRSDRHLTSLAIGTELPDFTYERLLVGSDQLALESTRCDGSVAGTMLSKDVVLVAWLKEGRGWIRDMPLPLGQPTLFRHDPDDFRWEAFQHDVLHISRAVVESVAAERGAWTPGPIEFDPLWIPEGAPLAAWWVMVRQLAQAILAGPRRVSPDRARQLARLAANGLLTAIPHWPVGKPNTAPAQSRLARAETFMLDHAREQFDVEDAASAAGLSVRGLQHAFRREHGTTPLVFLRGVRLSLAREELIGGSVDSIATIARRSGFLHLGRFAAAYRLEFGELPSDTQRATGLDADEWKDH